MLLFAGVFPFFLCNPSFLFFNPTDYFRTAGSVAIHLVSLEVISLNPSTIVKS